MDECERQANGQPYMLPGASMETWAVTGLMMSALSCLPVAAFHGSMLIGYEIHCWESGTSPFSYQATKTLSGDGKDCSVHNG